MALNTEQRQSIKSLNEYLAQIGRGLEGRKIHYRELEDLFNDSEFSTLVHNILFVNTESHKFLAQVYVEKARRYGENV